MQAARAAFRRSAVLNAAPVGLMAAYVLAVAALGAAYHFDPFGMARTLAPLWAAAAGLLALAAAGTLAAAWFRGTGLEAVRPAERLAAALPVLFAAPVFIAAFMAMKSAIPELRPFSLDPALARLDALIHGGPAWRLLKPLLGAPAVSGAVDQVYVSWIVFMYASVVAAAAWIERPQLRLQFLLTYVLCWVVLGTLAAALMSSAGPCYYGAFYRGPDPFADHFALLRGVDRTAPLQALRVQAALLDGWRHAPPGASPGISAMPSLHVAIAALWALTGWKISRPVGTAATLYLAVIVMGSVWLGWHYAVDAYASLLAVPALWALSGWWARRQLEGESVA
jgi:hypothetical protein